ncbi:MAG: hypothetical protein QNJ74_24910 [Trichodesmium sp. MO_231.B1]|nr:hypothetical protein [Trichodesmium sp. MO_231.B1]
MCGINRDSHCNQLYASGEKKPSYVNLTKQFITQAKRELLWLKEVASTPLQQSLKDLDQAYKNFFNSCTGKGKGIKKKRKSKQTARFVGANYKVGRIGNLSTKSRQNQNSLQVVLEIYLPKVGKIKIVCNTKIAKRAYISNNYQRFSKSSCMLVL